MGIKKITRKPKQPKATEISPPLPSPSSAENDSPIRSIVCLKRKLDMDRIEESEDCFILEFDPFDSTNYIGVTNSGGDDGEIYLVAEKGQVACRDYPHSRHSCLKNAFDTSPHEKYCKLCYCYVCDSAAPCKYWLTPGNSHCHASDKEHYWRSLRRAYKKVACRDYPHSRHSCSKNAFDTSPHEKYCKLCYCYVCDSAAPCKYWLTPGNSHCHASDKEYYWISQRRIYKKVACRDYPHSRHSCSKNAFDTSPHEKYCKLCYCYVCDSAAPCKYWLTPGNSHCHASDKEYYWISQRRIYKKVACRDYPHSRHSCSKNAFDTSPHEKYCKLCYCYVCDSAAPCKYWLTLGNSHCHASDKEHYWRSLRRAYKKVACRDYPHSRHLCSKNAFDTSPHEKYCKLCYCYVCDSAAPCKYWLTLGNSHCHASDKEHYWRSVRRAYKKVRSA